MSLFSPMQTAIARLNRERSYDNANHPRCHELLVKESDGLFDVKYRGEYELWFNDRTKVAILDDLFGLLASPPVAPLLRSFIYRTDGVLAANGTYPIFIDSIFNGHRPLPRLTRFVMDQGHGEHGYKILASARNGGDGWYDEAGVLADLLDRAPMLQDLATPSPPSRRFFEGYPHPLQSLDVDTGFGHVNFIRNLAECSRFSELRRLVFTDDRNRYLDDWHTRTTSFEDYLYFFNSRVAAQLESIYLREVNLNAVQIRQLLDIRSKGVEISIADRALETGA